ncbi:MAG: ATP-binding protein [Lachnospiraceae bacterium]|nr:ATP-binding protein [Lachnospiraceae bacterium]
MYHYLSRLVVYRNIEKDSILFQLAEIVEQWEKQKADREETVNRLYEQVNRLLEVATRYGFDGNLWQNYLAYLLAMTETPFGLVCEKRGAAEGSVNVFAKADFEIFRQLFHYDFSRLEKELEIDCFSVITDYHSVAKAEKYYNKSVSDRVRELSRRIAAAVDREEVFSVVTEFYQEYGVGLFGLNKAFRLQEEDGKQVLVPITNTEEVCLDDLIGYEEQKNKLVENTRAFVEGRKANNVLLYGDAGTGKSTSIKAILNEYYKDGLRMIEIYKHQFSELAGLISRIKNRNYKFIIYMDDLSFEEFEIEYKYLKAVIEGGLEIKPDNVLIYATSNRRHLIRETWSDRSDISKDELHRSDTMQEKLSLVARFGISICFLSPNQKQFFGIVKGLAEKYPELTLSEEELLLKANAWEISHGGKSGRTAQQFITYLLGKQE